MCFLPVPLAKCDIMTSFMEGSYKIASYMTIVSRSFEHMYLFSREKDNCSRIYTFVTSYCFMKLCVKNDSYVNINSSVIQTTSFLSYTLTNIWVDPECQPFQHRYDAKTNVPRTSFLHIYLTYYNWCSVLAWRL